MNGEQVLILLVNSLSLESNKRVFSWVAVNLWEGGTLEIMLDSGLLTPVSNAETIQCQGCENNCAVDVIPRQYPKKLMYFAVCDDPHMNQQMGRMVVPKVQIKQWQISIKLVAKVIAKLLDLSSDISYKAGQKSIPLGALKSKATGRKSVVLNVEPSLSLMVNQSQWPINELLYLEDNKLALDKDKINHALNLKKSPAVKTYRANTDKKELRKANTQAMYQDWQEEAVKLKNLNTTMSKKWVSIKIAKMAIAQGKDFETIRRNINI
jgi:hypothetical protein